MKSVILITMVSIWLIVPLGILKGLVLRFIAPVKSIHHSIIVNIILHFAGVCLFCFGGYYFSKVDLISYDFFVIFNIIAIISIGFIMLFLDKVLTRKLIISYPDKFSTQVQLFIICWWIAYSSFFALPLFMLNDISFPDRDKTKCKREINIGQLSAERVEENFLGKKLVIHSYPYGGIIVDWNGRKRIFNCQTFFYRWSPGSFYFDRNAGIIIFKVNREIFSYDIQKDKLKKL